MIPGSGLLSAVWAIAALPTTRSIPGYDDEDIRAARELNHDIVCLNDVIRFQPLPRLKDGTAVSAQDLYRVLALYKLGAAIDATKAMTLARSLIETWEQALAKAWHAGITPDTKVEAEVKKAQSHAGKKAANAHQGARPRLATANCKANTPAPARKSRAGFVMSRPAAAMNSVATKACGVARLSRCPGLGVDAAPSKVRPSITEVIPPMKIHCAERLRASCPAA